MTDEFGFTFSRMLGFKKVLAAQPKFWGSALLLSILGRGPGVEG